MLSAVVKKMNDWVFNNENEWERIGARLFWSLQWISVVLQVKSLSVYVNVYIHLLDTV